MSSDDDSARSATDPGQGAGAGPATSQTARAREICLRQLEAWPRSRAELAATLGRRGIDPDTAETVLDRLVSVGLVDDEAFARALVSSARANRGLGRRGLSHELRRRGVDREISSAALADVDADDEEMTARELVRRRLPAMDALPAHVRVRRLTALLDRRGFPPDLVIRVVADEIESSSDESGSDY